MTLGGRALPPEAWAAEGTPPPLTRRAWLLLPLVAVGLFGIALPVWNVEIAPRAMPSPEPLPEKLVPYGGELLDVIENARLAPEELRVLEDEHARLTEAMRTQGGIPESEAQRVRRVVEQYGSKPR